MCLGEWCFGGRKGTSERSRRRGTLEKWNRQRMAVPFSLVTPRYACESHVVSQAAGRSFFIRGRRCGGWVQSLTPGVCLEICKPAGSDVI
ncbi:hypothetical protein BHE74_00055571 [Ensete ventricosum]|nr:hypothetical protein BHE74_00055571 [Ensete ventricosum]